MAKPVDHRIPKHVIPGKVQNWDHKIFVIQKVAASEQEVVVQFSRRVKYQVVKLNVKDLPPKDADGRKITWINNFAVVSSPGHTVKRVRYTLFLPEPTGKATFVYYDEHGLHRNKKPRRKGSKPPQPGLLQVDLTTGDPGAGWR